MIPAPSSPAIAGVAALPIAIMFLALGYGISDLLIGARPWDRIVRLGLAFPGLLLFSLAVMLVHIITGGEVFSNAAVTRALVLLTAVLLVAKAIRSRRRRDREGDEPAHRQHPPRVTRVEVYALIGVLVVAVLLWGYPATQLLPIDHISDSTKHAAWASELMVGETTPSAPITGEVPNYYPWLYHALAALVAHHVPGGRALHALTPIFFIQVLGSVLALFALGRELTRRWHGGVAAAVFGALAGGWGYLVSKGPAIVLNPRENGGEAALRYLGDMVYVRTYNMSFSNLAPAFPRDIGFALLPACLLLMIIGLTRRSTLALIGAGVTIGLMGLSTGEATLWGFGLAGLLVLVPMGFGRLKAGAALFAPALLLWSLWVVPLFLNYSKYEGFRDMINSPVRLTPLALLGCWGMATPFALLGFGRLLPRVRSEAPARILFLSLLAALGLVLGALVVPLVLGTGFTTLSRQHRYWPLLYLSVALYAAVGASWLVDALLRRGQRILATSMAALSVTLTIPSPALASVALPEEALRTEVRWAASRTPGRLEPVSRSMTAALEGRPDSMLQLMTPARGVSCVAAVPPEWSRPVWSFTGYRLVLFRWWTQIKPDASHIRWKAIYDYIPPVWQRLRALRVLLNPDDRSEWERVTSRWDVDVVVIPRRSLPPWLKRNHRVEESEFAGRPAMVVWTSRCAEM